MVARKKYREVIKDLILDSVFLYIWLSNNRYF